MRARRNRARINRKPDRERSLLALIEPGFETRMALHAAAETRERPGPVVLHAIGQSHKLGSRIAAAHQFLLYTVGMSLGAAAHPGSIVCPLDEHGITKRRLDTGILALAEGSPDRAGYPAVRDCIDECLFEPRAGQILGRRDSRQ